MTARNARTSSAVSRVEIARSLGAEDQGEEQQEDTYFSLGRYRLKLRETSRGDHRLIGYSRADDPEARKSQYRMTPVGSPSSMKLLLSKQWGVKVVVKKTRHLFLWEGRVRIHLDHVESLGDFLEFEAVLSEDDPDYDECAALLDVARLRHDFGIEESDLIATSYSALAQQSNEIPSGT